MSDQTLRESVAAQMRAAADNYQISTIGPGDARQIADLLDGTTPVQVEITDEAVEAVMRDLALWDDDCSLPFIPDEPDGGRAAVRHILTVAAPLLGPRPLLDREAVRRILGDVRALPVTRSTNPHVEAVMELARPMPTRETLATAVDPEAFDETRKRSQHPAAVVQWAARKHMAYKAADAVLALLNGAES